MYWQGGARVQLGPQATPPLRATVAICTRNRADSLARTLASIQAAAEHVSEPWELLLIDNGSTDHTPAVVESFAEHLPIRRIYEGKAGLSNARNAGVANARGEYMIWTDDDVMVDREWLSAYLGAFARSPQHAIFGGRAIPRYLTPAPDWFLKSERDMRSLLAIRDDTDWQEITSARLPYGLNYAVRTSEQRKHVYDPELGVAPGRRRGGEEVAMIRSALQAGATGIWVWDAQVHHLIPRERQTMRYIHEFYRANGYDFPSVPLDAPGPRIGRIPLSLIGQIVRKSAMTGLRIATRSPGWVASFVDLSRCLGTMDRFKA